MATRTTGRTVIARVVVRAHKIERRVEQACLLQTEIDGIGTIIGAEAAWAKAFVRLAVLFFSIRVANLKTTFAASFEHTKNVAGL